MADTVLRLLFLHCDFVEYQPIKKEINIAEETSKDKRRIEEAVLVLASVEKEDDQSVVDQSIDSLVKTGKQLGTNSFVLYPYAHLSADLASPATAKSVVQNIEDRAKNQGLEIHHVPFGWNKSLSMKVKGHPLAEQSKFLLSIDNVRAEKESDQARGKDKEDNEILSAALKAEDTLKSVWYIIDPLGDLHAIEKFDFSNNNNLEKLKNYEITKVRAVNQVPPHVTLMKKLGLVDYEPASDSGNLRYYPKGRMIKSLLERYITQRIQEYGGIEVETPIMYDLEHPALASYLNRFPARQYIVKSEDKDYFLRFSACFGQFLIAKDLQLSYKQLPLKVYELTRYSFRREKSGELVGLRRLRAFTMPDCHAIVRDLDQAKEEFGKRFLLSQSVLSEIGFDSSDYELAIRFTEDFYAQNKEFIASIIKKHGKPALVEMWKEQFFYFVLKWEFNFIDNLNKASALSTDQIDTENAERFGISYVDEYGHKKTPLILHNSPSGAVERCIYGLLEKAAKDQKSGRIPSLPLWLAPSQIRLIPVSTRFLENCENLSNEVRDRGIRVDIDDREESVGKRIRDAEKEWVPYVVVFGEKESNDSSKLSVRTRSSGETKEISLGNLIDSVLTQVEGKTRSPLPLPRLISQRAVFEQSN